MSLQSKALKTIAICVIVAFMTVTLRVDLLMAATRTKAQSPAQQKVTSSVRFQTLLKDTEKLLEGMGVGLERKRDVSTKLKELRRNRSDLQDLADTIRVEFTKTREELIAKELPPEIIQRHDAFVQNFEDNFKILLMDLDEIEKPREGGLRGILKGLAGVEKSEVNKKRVEAAREHLKKNIYKKKHIPLDPNKLPHRRSDLKPRKPITDPKEFKKLFPKNQQSSLSGSGSTILSSILGIGTAYAQEDPIDPYLAETIEVQFSQEIQDLAASLDHDPVKIYEWVRNNVEFVPTYGSIQGAHMTLLTKQGNAFDISSLLIAVLRVSNIKARYVYGTIEVPIDEVMNWVGGFTDAKSAADFIASGGIPITSVIAGGKITKVWMEHVWVEAFVDYIPSRGALHKEGDTWIPMDPSFKQFNDTVGIDMTALSATLGFDPAALIIDANNSATKDEETLSATLVDTMLIENQLNELRINLLNYFQEYFPNANINDVLCTRSIRQKSLIILPATLPYRIISPQASFSFIPSSLQHRLVISLLPSDSYLEPLFSHTSPLASIGSKQLTISYFPATKNDENTAESFGGILKTPAYLLDLNAFLKLEGDIIETGGPITLGKSQELNIRFEQPHGTSDSVKHEITAGGYYAIILDSGGAPEILLDQQEKIQAVINKDEATKEESIGQIFHGIGISYFLQTDIFNNIAERALGVVNLKLGSEGAIGTAIPVEWLFDVPMKASFKGFFIDVKRNINAPFSKDGDVELARTFMLNMGIFGSGLEHGIFEEFMATKGVSAVKLLTIANDSGVPIYFINDENVNTILPKLSIPPDDIRTLRDGVNAGKIIYVTQQTLTANGFTGIGYLILDPLTGAGGYIISGGLGTLNGNLTLPDDNHQELELVLECIYDAASKIIGLVDAPLGVAAEYLLLVHEIAEAYEEGTCTFEEAMGAMAVWVAALVATVYLVKLAAPLTLAAAITAGATFGAGAAIYGAVAAIAAIVVAAVAINFLSKYIISFILAFFYDKRRMYAQFQLLRSV